MSDRPELNRQLSGSEFREYYYLKEELTAFCRENGLRVSGSKTEIAERIAVFLDTGEVRKPSGSVRRKPESPDVITADSVIEADFVCSEKHRAFFRKEIGKAFSFNVPFQHWLKNNAGKTYRDAIAAYHEILKDKKTRKTAIGRQFEYNTYIRDFFADKENKGKTLNDAIKCWNYKKSLKGHNKYEASDISALDS